MNKLRKGVGAVVVVIGVVMLSAGWAWVEHRAIVAPMLGLFGDTAEKAEYPAYAVKAAERFNMQADKAGFLADISGAGMAVEFCLSESGSTAEYQALREQVVSISHLAAERLKDQRYIDVVGSAMKAVSEGNAPAIGEHVQGTFGGCAAMLPKIGRYLSTVEWSLDDPQGYKEWVLANPPEQR